jgi:hypothetical protein
MAYNTKTSGLPKKGTRKNIRKIRTHEPVVAKKLGGE